MKKPWMKYLLVGIAVYLVIIVVRFPAQTVYGFVADSLKATPAKVELYRVDGSIWNGSAQYARVSGRNLRDVKWDLHLMSLFTGKLGATVSFRLDEGSVRASVYRSLGGDFLLEDVKARIPMAEIIRMAKIPAIKLEGQLGVNLKELSVTSEAVVEQADGRVVWNGAESRFPQKVALGDLSATLSTTDEGVQAVLGDAGGPLEVGGTLKVSPSGDYDFTGVFAAREGKNTPLGRSLSMMGRPDPQGKVNIKNSGNLKAFNFLFK